MSETIPSESVRRKTISNSVQVTQDSQPTQPTESPDDRATNVVVRGRDNVFISYAHADAENDWYKELRIYLKQLERTAQLDVWTDEDIPAGTNWKEAIDNQLQLCRVAILLLTANAVNSNYINDEELPEILKRHMSGGLIVHPILAEPADIKHLPIGDLISDTQRILGNERTLDQLEKPELRQVLQNLVEQIRDNLGQVPSSNTASGHELVALVRGEFDVNVERRLPGGDTSIIYKVKQGQLDLVSKVFVVYKLNERDRAEIEAEIEKARRLSHAAFIRMHAVCFESNHCASLVDYIAGVPLSQYVRQKAMQTSVTRDYQNIVKIMLRLAKALTEAHEHNLEFIELTPHQVIVFNDRPFLYPVSFSQWLFERERQRGMYRAPRESVVYLAPEDFYGARFRDPGIERIPDIRERRRALIRTAHQYCLGMIGLHMLEQRVPFHIRSLADLSQLERFYEDPRSRLKSAQWFRDAPGLARIISRMLNKQPHDRWPDMETVSQQLEALVAKVARAHVGEAKISYDEVCRGNEGFYRCFYQEFLKRSENAAALFDSTNWPRQYAILDGAIGALLNYRDDQGEPTTLSHIVATHKNMGLDAEDFKVFGEVFLETLRRHNVTVDRVDSWEAVIWPGLNYLIANCASRSISDAAP